MIVESAKLLFFANLLSGHLMQCRNDKA